ncbi:MAG: type III-B CRISPR module RAMP protein Cmr6 [bacterium]
MESNIGYLYNKVYFENYLKNNNHNFTNDIIAASKSGIITNTISAATSLFKLTTVYPGLIAGAGYEHEVGGNQKNELKFGCFFDYTTGMPVIPGSSIKGVIRSAFPQRKNSCNTSDEIKNAKAEIIWDFLKKKNQNLSETCNSDFIDNLESDIFDGKKKSVYKRDIFYDASIVEVEKNAKFLATDVLCPHKGDMYSTQSPDVLQFLKVSPNVTFAFSFSLHDSILSIGESTITITKQDKIDLFNYIIKTQGLGAKTNVGYGRFEEPSKNNNT